MSLDTYGFISDCGGCIRQGLSKMTHEPWSEAGLAEAKASFGELWEKYKEDYLYFANYMKQCNDRFQQRKAMEKQDG